MENKILNEEELLKIIEEKRKEIENQINEITQLREEIRLIYDKRNSSSKKKANPDQLSFFDDIEDN